MMNIVVLAGGISTEREVSIVSGTMVCKALRSLGYAAILVDVYCGAAQTDFLHAFPQEYDVDAAADYIKSFQDKIEEMKRSRREFFGPDVLKLCQMADVVFMALHGADGEGGKVQAAFDLMGIRYTGSGALGSAVAMDKNLSRRLFAAAGVPTAAGTALRRKEVTIALAQSPAGLPCIVKPCCGGSSVGASVARTQEEYRKALELAFGYEDEVIVEKFIEGREFSVGVVESRAYPVIEIAPIEGFYDYKNKYQAGSTIETCPAALTPAQTARMQELAVKAYHALKLECYGRMDFMMDAAGGMYCLEANTLPGMTPTSLLPQEAAALGIDYPALCELLIQVSQKKGEA